MNQVIYVERGNMQKGIHPKNYREVAFKDITSGQIYIIKSTANCADKVTVDGKEYPLYNVDASSSSHPFYTGQRTTAKATGRVDRFNRLVAKKK